MPRASAAACAASARPAGRGGGAMPVGDTSPATRPSRPGPASWVEPNLAATAAAVGCAAPYPAGHAAAAALDCSPAATRRARSSTASTAVGPQARSRSSKANLGQSRSHWPRATCCRRCCRTSRRAPAPGGPASAKRRMSKSAKAAAAEVGRAIIVVWRALGLHQLIQRSVRWLRGVDRPARWQTTCQRRQQRLQSHCVQRRPPFDRGAWRQRAIDARDVHHPTQRRAPIAAPCCGIGEPGLPRQEGVLTADAAGWRMLPRTPCRVTLQACVRAPAPRRASRYEPRSPPSMSTSASSRGTWAALAPTCIAPSPQELRLVANLSVLPPEQLPGGPQAGIGGTAAEEPADAAAGCCCAGGAGTAWLPLTGSPNGVAGGDDPSACPLSANCPNCGTSAGCPTAADVAPSGPDGAPCARVWGGAPLGRARPQETGGEGPGCPTLIVGEGGAPLPL